jgi:hypothetical protein
VKRVDFPVGTRIEIGFGPAIPEDSAALFWAAIATEMAEGQSYEGKSSPWWYDAPQFDELLSAKRNKRVADYIRERKDDRDWENWLQTHRVELNAMTTPQLIEWLDKRYPSSAAAN